MARPLRIEFEGAWYHVMNRGAGRRIIYPVDRLRTFFLELLDNVHQRFGVEIHAWCLMPNHYHLLLRTPRTELPRTMRHVDGVFTQRHNRLQRTDGPLFRGRYKAILVDGDSYLTQLSRYIHLNPVEAGLASHPERWQWSSYRSYVGLTGAPAWMYTDVVLEAFAPGDAHRRYREFVDAGIDHEIRAFFGKARTPPVLGSDRFRASLASYLSAKEEKEVPDRRVVLPTPAIAEIIEATATAFGVTVQSLITLRRGRQNIPRAVAMSLCRSPGGYALAAVAQAFGVRSYAAVDIAARRLRKHLCDPDLKLTIERLQEQLFGRPPV